MTKLIHIGRAKLFQGSTTKFMPIMETDNANVKQAEDAKLLANEAYKAHKFAQAIDLYTQAIELNSQNAVYWANRSIAHLKLEEYGSAIQDASKAIEGYYRRGAAYLAMGKFKEALKDFQQVKRICPNDPDATKKLKECEKAVMKLKFAEAISVPEAERRPVADSINYHSIGMAPSMSPDYYIAAIGLGVVAALVMFRAEVTAVLTAVVATIVVVIMVALGARWWRGFHGSRVNNLDVETQYAGARIEGDVVTLDFVKKMMEDFKNQKNLHQRYAFQIVLQTKEMLQAMPSLVDINIPEGKHFTVCGDVHGQFYDLLNIFELNGLPSDENPYLFNGDFVDRGSFSLEVILTLFAFKCMSPSAIYLARGNHESKSMNRIYGFEGEVQSKLSEKFVELFAEVFCCLPLAHVINGKVFVVHGGLFSVDGVKLSDIRAINRFCEPPEEGLMCEMLWSDPQPAPGRGPSKRGVGLSFGGDVTKKFLQENNLDLVVRSHEVKDEGYEIEHDGKLITVFSAPNYCDQMGNKGAFIRFESPDLKPNIVTFSAVPHPDVKPMAYANNFLRMFHREKWVLLHLLSSSKIMEMILGDPYGTNPGPIDGSVLYDQDKHVSSAVWDGQNAGLRDIARIADTFITDGLDQNQADSIEEIRSIAHQCLGDQVGGLDIPSPTPQSEFGKRIRGKERVRRKGMGKRLRKDDPAQYITASEDDQSQFCGTTVMVEQLRFQDVDSEDHSQLYPVDSEVTALHMMNGDGEDENMQLCSADMGFDHSELSIAAAVEGNSELIRAVVKVDDTELFEATEEIDSQLRDAIDEVKDSQLSDSTKVIDSQLCGAHNEVDDSELPHVTSESDPHTSKVEAEVVREPSLETPQDIAQQSKCSVVLHRRFEVPNACIRRRSSPASFWLDLRFSWQ
ncbi:hypothetical protein DVH24_027824 [Malus domestica]|uniref:Serine/threonine-protein phosphatase 5 n=1 Tax=Malus domestica TaxID=3750 RepID=A0A498HED7_MALDO|nr:hypothetical protein DVH24_027824 [Malus domestica]